MVEKINLEEANPKEMNRVFLHQLRKGYKALKSFSLSMQKDKEEVVIGDSDSSIMEEFEEISRSSFTNFLNFLQNTSLQFSDEKLSSLAEHKETFNLDQSSKFLAIGCGFGQTVLHVALQINCETKGIESRVASKFFNNLLIDIKKEVPRLPESLSDDSSFGVDESEIYISEILNKYKKIQNERVQHIPLNAFGFGF